MIGSHIWTFLASCHWHFSGAEAVSLNKIGTSNHLEPHIKLEGHGSVLINTACQSKKALQIVDILQMHGALVRPRGCACQSGNML